MPVLANFLKYAWELGITVEFGEYIFYLADRPSKLVRLRLSINDQAVEETFPDIAALEKALLEGFGTDIARRLCVAEFKG